MTTTSSTYQLNVHLLPELTHPHELAGEVVVVIDVLRATSTLAAALAAGATEIVPCLEVDEARQLARQGGESRPSVLGGERGGRKIEGFDLGNSPTEYTPDLVADRRIVFTTTNGTRAMMRCVGAGRVLLAAFTNLSAICRSIFPAPRLEILCAGTEGNVSWEDTLCAGAIVDQLYGPNCRLNDAARIAWRNWIDVGGREVTAAGLAEALQQGQGGRNLMAIERRSDIDWAARVDRINVVPELFLDRWSIRLADDRGVDASPN